jgi:hypothetical protein
VGFVIQVQIARTFIIQAKPLKPKIGVFSIDKFEKGLLWIARQKYILISNCD